MMALDNECTAAAPQHTRTEGTWSFTAPRFPSFSLIRSTCFLIVIRYLPDIGIVNVFICLFILHFSWASACLIFVCHHLMIRASYRDVLLQNHFCLFRFSGTSLALFLWLFSYLNELFARYWNCKLIYLLDFSWASACLIVFYHWWFELPAGTFFNSIIFACLSGSCSTPVKQKKKQKNIYMILLNVNLVFFALPLLNIGCYHFFGIYCSRFLNKGKVEWHFFSHF